MKEMILTRGYVALIDDEDFEKLSQWKWSYNGIGYAVRGVHFYSEDRKRHTKTVLMHRVIMDAPVGKEVDHINGNRLDNRKENLRLCTRQQNCFNNASGVNSSSCYRGASYNNHCNKWMAQLNKDGKHYFLGWHKTEIEAGYAFDQKAKELFGEFARLNGIKREDVIFNTIINSSIYRGVSWDKTRNKWAARLSLSKYKMKHVGRYDTEIEAALAYNVKALELKGDKAKLNIIIS